MARMTVIKAIRIEKSAEYVFPLIHDFHNWIHWSPWHVLDDSNNYSVAKDGSFYEWNSKLLGSGNMTRISEVNNETVEFDLLFLKPFRSKSKIIFRVKAISESACEVIWEMHGKLPFFLFFLIKMMERTVGMDFLRGLQLLKDFAEHETNQCQILVLGIGDLDTLNYIGIPISCSFDKLGENNKKGFEDLMVFVRENDIALIGPPATIYHEFNVMKNTVRFTVAAPSKNKPNNLKTNMIFSSFKGGKFYGVELQGPYHHIGSAWAALSVRQRSKVFVADKKRDSIEVYLNSPLDTPLNKLVTRIYSPIK